MIIFARRGLLAGVVALLAIGPAVAIELSPHRAVYSMNILSVRSNSDFVDIRGQMLLDWSDVCDGWTLNQRVKMIFTPREGKPLENEFSFSSWESKDGSRFRYTMRTVTNGNVVEEVDGRATARSNSMAVSAQASLSTSGVWVTTSPRARAASRSM